jgi:hypothetical protein
VRPRRLQFDLSAIFVAVGVVALVCLLFRGMQLDVAGMTRCAAATVAMTLAIFAGAIVMRRVRALDELEHPAFELLILLVGLFIGAISLGAVDAPWHWRPAVVFGPLNLTVGAIVVIGSPFGRIGNRVATSSLGERDRFFSTAASLLPRGLTRAVWITTAAAAVLGLSFWAALKLVYELPPIPRPTAGSAALTGVAISPPEVAQLARVYASVWPVWLLLAAAIYDARRLREPGVNAREASLRLSRIGASQSAAALVLCLHALWAWQGVFTCLSTSGVLTPELVLESASDLLVDVLPPWIVFVVVVGMTHLLLARRWRDLLTHAGWMCAAASVGIANVALYGYWSLCEVVGNRQ